MSSVCCKCYLIDEGCLRAYTRLEIGNGVTFDRLQKELIIAHELDLMELIGETCYNELCEAKENNTLTPEQQELIEKYITPYVSFLVEYYYLNGNIRYTAAGAVNLQGNSFTQPSGKEISNAESIAKRNVERYKVRLIDFLIDNSTIFTCFDTECLPCDYKIKNKFSANTNYGYIKGV